MPQKLTSENYLEIERQFDLKIEHVFKDMNKLKLEVSLLKKDAIK